MSEPFSCKLGSCNLVFRKESDLKKHMLEHTDPSKLYRCSHLQCNFFSKYARGLRIHENTHNNKRPLQCPDMVVATLSNTPSGSTASPAVSEIPCTYRSNCHSALLKHRKKNHNYVPNPKGSRRRDGSTISRADRRAKASPYVSVPLPSKATISSNDGASYSAKSSSTCAHPTATTPSSSMVQPLNNEPYATLDTRYGEVQNYNPYDLAAGLDASVATQDHYAHHGVATGACPILPPNDPAMVSSNPVASRVVDSYSSESAGSYSAYGSSPAGLPFDNRFSSYPATLPGEVSNGNTFPFAQEPTNANSAVASQYVHANRGALPFPLLSDGSTTSYYDSESFYTTNNDSAHTTPDLLHDSVSLPSLEEPITPGAESPESGSVASDTSNYGSSAYSFLSFPPSPMEAPFDDNIHMGASLSITQQNNSVDRDVALLVPTPPPVPDMLVDGCDSSDATDIQPSFSDFDTEIHEDEIFFRGTGREGCLCPEMMIDAGIDGWDGSFVNTHQQGYYPH